MAQRVASGAVSGQTPRQLYKYLIRECDRLPDSVRDYYKHQARTQFRQFTDETDAERVSGIMEQAVKDMAWVTDKYIKTDSGGGSSSTSNSS